MDPINQSDTPNQILHPYLRNKLNTSDLDDELEVIIQFKNNIIEKDLNFLKRLGFEIKYQYSDWEVLTG